MALSKRRTIKRTPKTILLGVGTVFVISLLVALGVYFINKQADTADTRESPTFTAVTPGGQSIDQFGGWQRISPPETEPVFVYTDEINDTPISVSQQPLPVNFQNDAANQLSQLAQGFNATEQINSDPDIYIGSSAQGPQSIITSKSGLLILITSKTSVENDAWISYINSLR